MTPDEHYKLLKTYRRQYKRLLGTVRDIEKAIDKDMAGTIFKLHENVRKIDRELAGFQTHQDNRVNV